jgi:hypothetical protein
MVTVPPESLSQYLSNEYQWYGVSIESSNLPKSVHFLMGKGLNFYFWSDLVEIKISNRKKILFDDIARISVVDMIEVIIRTTIVPATQNSFTADTTVV